MTATLTVPNKHVEHPDLKQFKEDNLHNNILNHNNPTDCHLNFHNNSSIDMFHASNAPRTADNDPRSTITLNQARAPTSWRWGHPINWYPTHATITVDGVSYQWDARSHRKLRYPAGRVQDRVHPNTCWGRVRFLGWEPRIATWYICIVNLFANTLWVLNGIFATWPHVVATSEKAELASFATGVTGAFLFIVSGYLGYIESINQTYSALYLPRHPDGDKDINNKKGSVDDKYIVYQNPARDEFLKTDKIYGKFSHFLVHLADPIDTAKLLDEGYPIVQDVESNVILTAPIFDRLLASCPPNAPNDILNGRPLYLRIGTHMVQVAVDHILTAKEVAATSSPQQPGTTTNPSKPSRYLWWTWNPDVRHIGIFNSLVFFISTIIFFIPACSWLPMSRHGATNASYIFWTQVLQIIPCIGFIYTGHAAMAEASGSWWKPKINAIGWWISLFNAIGSWGFMSYAVLAIPGIVDAQTYAALTVWGADFGTFWGSCAFEIAGILQCFEFGSQHPIFL